MKYRKSYRTSIPALILLFIYLLNPLKFSLPYLDYNLNYQYIKNFLCENKEKPELKCNGKCYLAKALKANQDKGENHQKLVPKNYCADEITTEDLFIPLKTYTSACFGAVYLEHLEMISQENSTPPPQTLV